MTLVYQSTRDAKNTVTASQAILQGLATDGGLFTPVSYPKVDLDFDILKDASYQEVCETGLVSLLGWLYSRRVRLLYPQCLWQQVWYTSYCPSCWSWMASTTWNCSTVQPSPLKIWPCLSCILLWQLLRSTAWKTRLSSWQRHLEILEKAAMAGFADVPGNWDYRLLSKGTVSARYKSCKWPHKLGDNTHVIAIDGNFDDAQTNVKHMFNV